MSTVRIKRGAALVLNFAFANADGTAWDPTGAAMSGAIRDPRDNLIAAFVPVAGAVTGTASATIVNTSAFPIGMLRADLAITDAVTGLSTISDTFPIVVGRAAVQSVPDAPPYNPVTAP